MSSQVGGYWRVRMAARRSPSGTRSRSGRCAGAHDPAAEHRGRFSRGRHVPPGEVSEGELVLSPTRTPPAELSSRSWKGEGRRREGVGRSAAEGGLAPCGWSIAHTEHRQRQAPIATPMHPRPPAKTKTGHERDHRRRRPGCPPRGVRVGPRGPGFSHRGPASQGHGCCARGGRELPGADRHDPRLMERRRPSRSVTRPSAPPTRTALLRTRGRAVGAHGSRQIRVRVGDVPPGGVARGRAEVLRGTLTRSQEPPDAAGGGPRRKTDNPARPRGFPHKRQLAWTDSRLRRVRCPASDGSSPPSIRVRLWR
jgi:hypothetical protein